MKNDNEISVLIFKGYRMKNDNEYVLPLQECRVDKRKEAEVNIFIFSQNNSLFWEFCSTSFCVEKNNKKNS